MQIIQQKPRGANNQIFFKLEKIYLSTGEYTDKNYAMEDPVHALGLVYEERRKMLAFN